MKHRSYLLLALAAVVWFNTANVFGQQLRPNKSTYTVLGETNVSRAPYNYNPNPQIFDVTLAQGFSTPDAIIGPEILTLATGYYDYHTNGDNKNAIWVDKNDPNKLHAIYTVSTEADPTGVSSRRTVYCVSADGGTTWQNLGEVPSERTGFGYLALKDGKAVIANHGRTPTSTIMNMDLDVQAGAFDTYVPSQTTFPIWPQANLLANGNFHILAETNPSDTLAYSTFDATSHSFSPWIFRYTTENPGTASNARWASATSTLGGVVQVVNPVSVVLELGSNKIYAWTSTDNGATFGAQQTIFTPYVSGSDTITAFFGQDVIYKPGTNDWYFVHNAVGALFRSASLWITKNGGTAVKIADSTNLPNLWEGANKTFAGLVGIDHPSLGWDADGNLYCAYSLAVNDTGANGFNTRDIYYQFSKNDGATWSAPIQVTNTPLIDEGYVSVSEWNKSKELNMVYMKDPGDGPTSFNGTSATAPPSLNNLVYRHITLADVVGIRNINTEINGYALQQNYPNPFNPTTTIRFSVPNTSNVSLKVFNVAGQEVATLINNEVINAGTSEISLDGSKLSTGIYFYTLTAGNFKETKKMMLIK